MLEMKASTLMRLLDGEAENLTGKTINFHSEQIMRALIAMKIVKRETGVCYTERCKITRPAQRLAAPPPTTIYLIEPLPSPQ